MSPSADTIRLKENNLRIGFAAWRSASFPTNDQQITANDSSNGGQINSLSTTSMGPDALHGRGGAKSHALYVDNGGRVGFGTKDPTVELPASMRTRRRSRVRRLQQVWRRLGTSSSKTSFFVRDATNGSLCPSRSSQALPGLFDRQHQGRWYRHQDRRCTARREGARVGGALRNDLDPVGQFIDGASESATLRSENGRAALKGNAFSVMGAGQDFTAFEVDGSTGRVDVGRGSRPRLGSRTRVRGHIQAQGEGERGACAAGGLEPRQGARHQQLELHPRSLEDPAHGPDDEDFFKALTWKKQRLSLADVTGVLFAAVQGLGGGLRPKVRRSRCSKREPPAGQGKQNLERR